MRVTAAERVRSSSVAEDEIARFAVPDARTGLRPHALWHKHVHNVELDPVQVLKMLEMDRHRNTVDFSCRRTGKTSVKEMYNLERLATEAYQECGIVAPRMQQSQNNLDYMLEAIRRSPMLSAFIAYKQGRPQLKDTGFEFANHSKGGAYGIMSQIDGDSITIASLEETDDMPQERLLSRFLPMLGAARRLGVDAGAAKFKPEIRISGVFKGAGVLQRLIDTGEYVPLTTVDLHLGLQLGVLDPAWAESMRKQLPADEYIRQFLCRNIQARNWIWEEHIRRKGRIGVVSRSGTLTYEAVAQLTEIGLGQSSAVGIGGDPINGLKHIDVMRAFNDDPDTDAVIMIGEIGGPDEAEAARWVKDNMKKPVVGFIAGVTAPPGKRMGHAGALISGGADTADAKLAIMEECGFKVTRNPSEMARLLKAML